MNEPPAPRRIHITSPSFIFYGNLCTPAPGRADGLVATGCNDRGEKGAAGYVATSDSGQVHPLGGRGGEEGKATERGEHLGQSKPFELERVDRMTWHCMARNGVLS